jgi:hypothetical protein
MTHQMLLYLCQSLRVLGVETDTMTTDQLRGTVAIYFPEEVPRMEAHLLPEVKTRSQIEPIRVPAAEAMQLMMEALPDPARVQAVIITLPLSVIRWFLDLRYGDVTLEEALLNKMDLVPYRSIIEALQST